MVLTHFLETSCCGVSFPTSCLLLAFWGGRSGVGIVPNGVGIVPMGLFIKSLLFAELCLLIG